MSTTKYRLEIGMLDGVTLASARQLAAEATLEEALVIGSGDGNLDGLIRLRRVGHLAQRLGCGHAWPPHTMGMWGGLTEDAVECLGDVCRDALDRLNGADVTEMDYLGARAEMGRQVLAALEAQR